MVQHESEKYVFCVVGHINKFWAEFSAFKAAKAFETNRKHLEFELKFHAVGELNTANSECQLSALQLCPSTPFQPLSAFRTHERVFSRKNVTSLNNSIIPFHSSSVYALSR